jgi:hypothetical protein
MDEDSPAALPEDRASARLQGAVRYFTGKPCPKGHLAPRYTSNGKCVVCLRLQVADQRRRQTKICSIEGCGRPLAARSWCHSHFERWRKTGDVNASVPIGDRVNRRPAGGRCAVDDCEKPRTHREWCGMHYERWRKHGDLDFTPEPWPSECSVEDCAKKPVARGLCDAHYAKLRRYGDVEWHRPVRPTDQVNYYMLHDRLRQARGSATAHQCVGECGRQARQWAWLHGEDPYDFSNYVPMCYSCHQRYDRSPDPHIQPWGIGPTPRPRRRTGGPRLPVLSSTPTGGMPVRRRTPPWRRPALRLSNLPGHGPCLREASRPAARRLLLRELHRGASWRVVRRPPGPPLRSPARGGVLGAGRAPAARDDARLAPRVSELRVRER